MAWVAVIAGGTAIVGGVMAKNSADKANKTAQKTSDAALNFQYEAQEKVQAAVDKLNALTPPNLLSYITPYQQQVIQGTLTPEEAVFQMQKDTELAGIQVPQDLLNAQARALTQIQQIADEGGLTAIDRAQLNEIQTTQANRSKAEQDAIIQDAQQRGVAGAGTEMAARLISQQQGANRAAASGLQVAADAQARRTAAITQAAQMASGQRDQSMNEQTRVAEAQDAINKFNTSFQNSTNAANVAARNEAAAQNLAAKQQVANFNAQQAQLEAAARAAAAQQQWQNTFNQATNSANVTAGLAGQANTANAAAQQLASQQAQQAAAQNAAAIQGVTSGIGQLVGAYGTYQNNQKKVV